MDPYSDENFAREIARRLKKMHPEYGIEITGPRELHVDGRRLDLENLYRMSNGARISPAEKEGVIGNYLDQLFGNVPDIFPPFSFIEDKILPRVQPNSIFKHLNRGMVAHVPWVNDTSIVFVRDMPHMTMSLTTENLVRWGVTVEDVEKIAMKNLENYSEFKAEFHESSEGGRAVIIGEHDGYDAARILAESARTELIKELGGDFLAAIPSRDLFLAITPGPAPFKERLEKRVKADYKRLPYPISPEWFYVTRDGVAGTIESLVED